MSGFMSSTTAMTICKVNSTVKFTLDALRNDTFTPDIDADGRRLGWVALGNPLDTDGFELASVDGRYSGFSFRLDTRKASGAVIRLQLADAVREERASGKKVGNKRKKELKEAITAKLTARAEFVPSVIDCIWDAEKGRLLIGSSAAKAVQPVLDLFKTTFGMDAVPITPAGDMPGSLPPSCTEKAIRAKGTLCIRWGPPDCPPPNRLRKIRCGRAEQPECRGSGA